MLLRVESPVRLGRNVFRRRATVKKSAAASVLTVAVSLPHVAKMAIGLSVIAGTFSSAEAPDASTSFLAATATTAAVAATTTGTTAATDVNPNITTGAETAAATSAAWHHRSRRRGRR